MKCKYFLLLLLPLLLASCARGGRTSSSSSSSPTTSTQPVAGDVDVSFVALNDFHGIVEPRNTTEVGLAKIAGYLKTKKSNGAILLNSGDSYQGSLLAGYDKGKMISEVFKDIDFDAYTIGNHEFDWGIDSIKANEEVLGKKFLGANIYTYPEKKKCEDLGENYTIKTINAGTENEVKVGIIGIIGKDQITSITSTTVSNYTFVDPTPIVKNLSTELRNEKGCDVVIADCHASIEQINSEEFSKCVDAVFLGHTHRQSYDEVNKVPFIQGGRYGEALAEVTLTVNKINKTVKNKSHMIRQLSRYQLEEDATAKQIIDKQKTIVDPIGNKKVGETDRPISNGGMSCFYSKIAYEEADSLGFNIDFVLFNPARYELYNAEFTYSNLYETNPFNNKLYVLSTNGYTIYRESKTFARQMGYNPNQINLEDIKDQKNTWYEVLVYDYNGLHIGLDNNGNKYYDYFAASFTGAEKHAPILLEGLEVFNLALSRLEKDPVIINEDYSGPKFINYYG